MGESSKAHIMIIGGNLIGKGAEAMLLTVRDTIKGAIPEAVCCVQLLREADCQQLKQYGFVIIKQRQQKRIARNINFALGLAGLLPHKKADPTTIGEEGIANIFKVSNIVVDISGFESSDQFGPRFAYNRWKRYSLARCAGNKIVLMPQSWGPFKNRWVRLFTRLMLRNSELVCAREKLSYDYLTEAGCIDGQKILLSPDIAFQFRASPPQKGRDILSKAGLSDQSKPIITITPNMRIFERMPSKDINNTYLSYLKNIIMHFLRETSCQIVLIPHEASFRRANDTELCKMLMDQIQDRRRVYMIRDDESAADIKAVIGLSEFLIASRYHSLIAALSLRIPSAVIGWSHKYDEVMRELGLEELVVDPVRWSNKLETSAILEAWEKREEIKKVLEHRVPKLEKQAHLALDRMVDVIKSTKTCHDSDH
jgi:polysaccharide pyruvyl transferase WcaK-like protein